MRRLRVEKKVDSVGVGGLPPFGKLSAGAHEREPPIKRGVRATRCLNPALGVVIYDSDLQFNRSIQSGDIASVYDVAAVTNDSVLIAATNGLFHLNVSGRTLDCIVCSIIIAV